MRYHFYFVCILLFIPISVFSQGFITSRSLDKELPSHLFYPLKYIDLDNIEVSGYGFVNPIDAKTLVFVNEKPADSIVSNWKKIKVKSATIYRDQLKEFVNKLSDVGLELNQAQKERFEKKISKSDDTLKVFFVRKINGAISNGLRKRIYENEQIRFFKFIPTPVFVIPDHLVLFQTTNLPVYESETYFLNYHNQKTFKRSMKRFFKKCPKIVENAEKGSYFPDSLKAFKQLANDYKLLCEDI